MESVWINDQHMMKTRRSVNRRPATNADRSTSLYSSMSSPSQLMMSMDPNQANIAHNHSPQLIRPMYSSLPPSLTSQPSITIPLPPLLPLPNSSFKLNCKPAFAANKKTNNPINSYTKNGARRKKLSKPVISSKSPPLSISKDTATNKEAIPKVIKLVQKTRSSSPEEFEDETIYPLSPPPSSLPLPSLALMRHRVANTTVSCTAESVGGVNGDGAVKSGSCYTARDDLLRLLCL